MGSEMCIRDRLNIGFLLQDMDDNILEVNEALLKMSGRNREEFIGHNVSQFYSEKEYKALRTGDLLQIDSEYYQGEYFIYNKDGTRIPVLFIVSINKNELGEPVSENVLVLDISKQKQFQARLKEANKELTAVNEALRMHQDSLQNEKMKLEAIKRQGKRHDLTSTQPVSKLRSNEELGQSVNESRETIRRYIRLNELEPELMQMVDEGKIGMTPAVEISYLKPDEQKLLIETIDSEQATPSFSQAQRMKKLSQEGKLNDDAMLGIMMEQKKPENLSLIHI